LTYTGSWVYVEDGREITVNVSERTNQFRQGWGDYIKSCTIQRTSTNSLPPRGNSFHFEISEGGKTIFKSPEMTNEEPVIYVTNRPVEPPRSAAQIQDEIESQLKKEDADWRKHREHELPVWTSYRMSDDCILVLHSYATNSLSLTVTAIKEASQWETKVIFPRTNSCQVNLAAGEAKDLDLLQGWILTPDDRVRIEIVNPKYDIGRSWISSCRTPSHKIAEQQEAIFKEFNQTNAQATKDNDAQILSDLWRAGLLKDEIKEQLVQEHYQLVLRQLPAGNGVPGWDVRTSQTFPFPNVYTAFTPTLFSNNQVKWSPGESQTSFAMSITNAVITSMTGGVFKNGDVLQCKIDLSQTVNGRSWQTSLKSNKITLQGLKD